MNEKYASRKNIRLHETAYEIPGACVSITICAQGKEPVFKDRAIASMAAQALRDSMAAYGMEVVAYCLMPTHLHVILHNRGGKSLLHAIRDFKQRTRHQAGRVLWQRSFYDHFIREEEDLRAAMDYVVNNPVRAGLAVGPDDYPWSFPKSKSGNHYP